MSDKLLRRPRVLLRDPDFRAAFITDAIETGSPELVSRALRDIGLLLDAPHLALSADPQLSELLDVCDRFQLRLRVHSNARTPPE